MIRALVFDCSKEPHTVAEVNPGEVPAAKDQPDRLLVVDLAAPSDADFAWLEQTFHFHPLTIEDARNRDQRPKLEEYDGYLFITVYSPRGREGEEPTMEEVHAFLGPTYVVFAHDRHLPEVEALFAEWRADPRDCARGVDFLFYRVADKLVDSYFTLLNQLDEDIDRLEDDLVVNPDRRLLYRIFDLKQDLVVYRKVASPQREVFNALLRRDYKLVQERNTPYFRDVYDHLVRVYELLDSDRDLLSNALDAYLSTVSNNLNEVMKRLTVVSLIFLPLTVITGFFGMNLTGIPFDSPVLMVVMAVLMVGTPAAMLWWFRASKWT